MHLCYLAQLTFQGHECQDYEKSVITVYIVHLNNILTVVSPVCYFALQKSVVSLPLVNQ